MSIKPRRYCLGQRQVAATATRKKIIAAARRLLGARRGAAAFSMEAVARKAGVTKMTVYHQFGSKRDLLDALFDDLAVRGLLDRLRPAFEQADPLATLTDVIDAFAGFWTRDRLVIRRIRALAVIDADFERSIQKREEWRRQGVATILQRIAAQHGWSGLECMDEAINLVWTLTRFETFDALAGAKRTPRDLAPVVRRLVFTALGLEDKA